MPPLSRFHVFATFVALMMLRVVIGFHFFKEGTDKIKDGHFSAEYFLRAAKGPVAPFFQKLIDDPEGRLRFCIGDDGKSVDPELTFALWDDFLDRAHGHFRFGDPEFERQISDRREQLAGQIQRARSERDPNVDVQSLEAKRADLADQIERLRGQAAVGEEILESHQQEFADWLAANGLEIEAWFATRDRVEGFDRDGDSAEQVAVYVESLREQTDTIKSDRQKQSRAWAGQVDAIWDSYEQQILALPISEQRSSRPLSLHRPFAQSNSKLQWINRVIPWFDTIVGGLLILGLFTRLASLAAAGFLASVIATQPPWIPGTEPTWFYAIELLALLVIFATCAGRAGGLDFFLSLSRRNQQSPEPAN